MPNGVVKLTILAGTVRILALATFAQVLYSLQISFREWLVIVDTKRRSL